MGNIAEWASLVLTIVVTVVSVLAGLWARSVKSDIRAGRDAVEADIKKLEILINGRMKLMQSKQIQSDKQDRLIWKKLQQHSDKITELSETSVKIVERLRSLRPSNPEMDSHIGEGE